MPAPSRIALNASSAHDQPTSYIYLVVFSYAFFWQGFTGLAITIISVITLFVVMQATGRIQ